MTETINHLYESLDAFWSLYIILFSVGYIISRVRTLGFKKVFAFLLPTGFILDPYRYQLEDHPILIPCIMCFLLGLLISTFKEYGFLNISFSLPNLSIPSFSTPKRNPKKAHESSDDHSNSFGYSEPNNRAYQEKRQAEREERIRQAREGTSRERQDQVQEEGSQLDTRTPMEILGLSEGYTEQELKRMHRLLRSRYHPRGYEHMPEDVKEAMKREFQAVEMAYTKLNEN